LSPGTTYNYRVKSKDAAGNLTTSANSTFATTAPAADTTQPTITMTAPPAGTLFGSTIAVSANASDNVGVVGVQFLLDGINLGVEDTSSPYALIWDTTQTTNGTHTLSARARDASGNVRTAANITVTVNNPTSISEDVNQDGHVNLLDLSLFAAKYGQTGTSLGRADINGDGVVNLLDLSRLASKYNTI
jgi:chitodextrinase